MGYKSAAKELGILHSMVQLWVKNYQKEGITGLGEKRGKYTGVGKGRPRVSPMPQDDELERLRSENEYLKKLWTGVKASMSRKGN